MRLPVLAALMLVAALSGCAADAEDPFAYTRKPLYTGYFELEPLADGKKDTQMFRVEDGSIARVQVHVWLNATAGSGKVEISDPSGRVVMRATESGVRDLPIVLGVWTVTITGEPDAGGNLGGSVSILARRA